MAEEATTGALERDRAGAWRSWVPIRVGRRYLSSDAGHWGTNIAWNALFSFIPILLLLTTLAALLFRSGRFESELARQLAPVFHTTTAEIVGVFNSVRDKFWVLALTTVVGLVWSGSSLFSCVECGLSRLSGFQPRPFVRRRVRAMRLTVMFCLLLLPVLTSSTLLAVPHGRLGWLDAVGRLGRPALIAEQLLLGTLLASALFLYIYRVAPNRGFRQPRRKLLPGALTAGLLLELLALTFPIYIGATDSSGSALVLLALPLLLAFFYCVGNIVVIGHLVNLETGDATVTSPSPRAAARTVTLPSPAAPPPSPPVLPSTPPVPASSPPVLPSTPPLPASSPPVLPSTAPVPASSPPVPPSSPPAPPSPSQLSPPSSPG